MYYLVPSNNVRGNFPPPRQMPSLYVRKLCVMMICVTRTLLIIN